MLKKHMDSVFCYDNVGIDIEIHEKPNVTNLVVHVGRIVIGTKNQWMKGYCR